MAQRLHGDGIEVCADPAELEHGDREQHEEQRKRHVAECGQNQPEQADCGEAHKGRVGETAHADTADQARIGE